MNKLTPYILLIVATLFWGGNFVMGKGFSQTIPPFTLAFFRWLIAFLFLLPFGYKQLVSAKQLWKQDFWIILAMAFTGIASFNTLVYIAVHYTSSINAALINAPTPAMIMFLSFLFLKEKLSISHYFGIIISIFGVLWIISHGSIETIQSFNFNKGEMIMLIAIFMWAVYSVLVKKFGSRYPMYGLFLIKMIIGMIILAPFSLYEFMTNVPMVWNTRSFIGLIYLGIAASVLAFLAWNKAVAELGPGKASPFLNLIPVFATFFAVIFLGEKLDKSQMIGGLVVILGVCITTGIFKPIQKPKQNKLSY